MSATNNGANFLCNLRFFSPFLTKVGFKNVALCYLPTNSNLIKHIEISNSPIPILVIFLKSKKLRDLVILIFDFMIGAYIYGICWWFYVCIWKKNNF
jgi:hypothetical protein